MTRAFLGILLATGFVVKASAQADPFEHRTLDCLFTHYTASSIEGGRFSDRAEVDKGFAITFSGFDVVKKQALLIGNAGSDTIVYRPSEGKALLVQITEAGNGSMTTISAPRGGVSIAYHSRHMWIAGQPVISHYYGGSCKVR